MDAHLTYFFFFFNDTATTEIYTLSLHDALPISMQRTAERGEHRAPALLLLDLKMPRLTGLDVLRWLHEQDRKSTRLNSSHLVISYAVFCLKKKKTEKSTTKYRSTELS